MMEQIGTPGSNADTSINGSKFGAPKDKQCPFCSQHFTSSSLGRHLDLYIREKNPKPADGIHLVDEIRKLRGGITRRQPRNSMSRREDSTPAATPGPHDRRSPPLAMQANLSSDMPPDSNIGKQQWSLNKASWQATGVMNNIPLLRNGDTGRGWDGEEKEPLRRTESRNRSVSKQMLAKTTLEQKQKMSDALDTARAAELALRELWGGIRAAKLRIDGPPILDYDPLTFDFPSLVLHCLPPPPTLYQSSPVSSPTSWSISPPDDQQYQALRDHFSGILHRWRVSCAVASNVPQDDLSYPSRQAYSPYDDPAELAQRAEASAKVLESNIADHLHKIYGQWTSLNTQQRTEFWTLELARSIGRKSRDYQTMKQEKELAQQEAAHLRSQVDELSRLQHPREFRLVPPTTIPLDSRLISELGEIGVNTTGIGWSLTGRNMNLDDAVELSINRWRSVVKEARGEQRPLSGTKSGESTAAAPRALSSQPPNVVPDNAQINSQFRSGNAIVTNATDSELDADADADMEDDVSYVEMGNVSRPDPPRSPMTSQAAIYRLANANGNNNVNGSSAMEGLEKQSQGYVRIGA